MEYNDGDSKELFSWKIQREQAFATHTSYQEDSRNVFNSAMGMALEAIRTAIIINGGAVIAIFAFLGSIFNSSEPATIAVKYALLGPAFLFAAGAVLSGVASGASYFSQILFSRAHEEYEMIWEHPYVKATTASESFRSWGDFWRAIAVALVVFSYAALTFGLIKAHSAISIGLLSAAK